jgi:hypothetical protein
MTTSVDGQVAQDGGMIGQVDLGFHQPVAGAAGRSIQNTLPGEDASFKTVESSSVPLSVYRIGGGQPVDPMSRSGDAQQQQPGHGNGSPSSISNSVAYGMPSSDKSQKGMPNSPQQARRVPIVVAVKPASPSQESKQGQKQPDGKVPPVADAPKNGPETAPKNASKTAPRKDSKTPELPTSDQRRSPNWNPSAPSGSTPIAVLREDGGGEARQDSSKPPALLTKEHFDKTGLTVCLLALFLPLDLFSHDLVTRSLSLSFFVSLYISYLCCQPSLPPRLLLRLPTSWKDAYIYIIYIYDMYLCVYVY